MIFLKLAFKSLRNRLFTTLLTIFSIALSLSLLLAVERTKRATEEGFTQAISQTDLIVGARTGPLTLILYTVFNMGNATNNISWESYQEIKNDPAVAWTIPYALGDGHRGFRIVATDENFYEHYRFRGNQGVSFAAGLPALGIWDAVLGSQVAAKLGYKLGDKIVVAHGVTRTEGVQLHDDKPFRVSGILNPTGTALDQSVYISLYGMEAVHMDWKDGAAPSADARVSPDQIHQEDLRPHQITAFFLRAKSRIDTLHLQRTINTYGKEPLLAIIPGVTLGELWRGLSNIERVLKAISWMVIGVGLTAMLIALLTSLNERRREMAILRALGARPIKLTALLVFESSLLTLCGVCIGVVIQFCGFYFLKDWLETQFGLFLTGAVFTTTEIFYILITIGMGMLIGLIPAVKASRAALKDGLSVRI